MPRGLTVLCNMLPAVLRVPAATQNTSASSTPYVMHILSTNTHSLLHMRNSIIPYHIHHFFIKAISFSFFPGRVHYIACYP